MGKVRKETLLLGTASMINDASSEIVKAIIAVAMRDSAGLWIGLVGGMIDGLSYIFRFISGYLSDKLSSSKPFIIAGYVVSAVSRIFLAIVPRSLYPLPIFFDRAGKGIRDSPRDAYLSEIEKDSYRGFSIQQTMDTFGAVIGSVAAYLLSSMDYRLVFLLAGIVGLTTIIPLSAIGNRKVRIRPMPRITKEMVVFVPFFLSNISYIFLLLKTGMRNPLPFYILYNISYALFMIPFGKERIVGRNDLLWLVLLVFSLNLALFSITTSPMMFAVLFAVHGMAFGFIRIATKSIIADSVTDKGTEIGMYNLLVGGSYLAGNLFYGILFSINPSLPFVVASFLAFLSAILSYLFVANSSGFFGF